VPSFPIDAIVENKPFVAPLTIFIPVSGSLKNPGFDLTGAVEAEGAKAVLVGAELHPSDFLFSKYESNFVAILLC
jgi:hypothetical protein